MVKTKGAVDLKKRKTRKDKGKRKKKLVLKKFKKKTGRKTQLKLFIYEQRPMSKEGYSHWSKHMKPKIRKLVYMPHLRIDAPLGEISSKAKVEAFILEHVGYPGVYYIKGGSGSLRSKRNFKWVTMCVIKITKHEEGLRSMMIDNRRMWRYKWFYKE